MLRAGVDPATAASLMGQAFVVMLRCYRRVTEADWEAAVAKAALVAFPPVETPVERHGIG